MSEISPQTQRLIQQYQTWWQSLQHKKEVPTLHVDEVTSRVAAFYEKIRGVIEWQDEHLLRKAAIERILKRRLLLSQGGEEIAGPFILELIRGGYFPNDSIEESKTKDIQNLLDKYTFIIENSPGDDQAQKVQLYNWLLGVAACEVEDTLSPFSKERALIDYMSDLIKERVEIREGVLIDKRIKEEEKNNQIYIACHRALFKLDSPTISYNLLKKKVPGWDSLPFAELQDIAKDIFYIWEGINKDLKHPLAEKFYQICEKYDTPYLILGDILSENPTEASRTISQPDILENSIRQAYQKRLGKTKERVRRAAIFSTISIFVTKIVLALLLEVPAEKWLTDKFNYSSLGFNILIPPALMFLMVLTIRTPARKNLQIVIMEIMKIVFRTEKKDTYVIKLLPKKGFGISIFLTLFYIVEFMVSFGLIIWLLQKLGFWALSIAIFIVFLSLILFAATRIRQRARELQIGREKESFLTFLFDLLTLPIVRTGKWLSSQWERYNVMVVLFNAFIELPFQLFTEFLEQWVYFIREKKEEIH